MRGGVLSDLSIQSAYPEFQAPNLGLASALEMIVMDKHEFTGIKMPKDIKRKRVSRFPINDIANLSSLSENKAKTLYASVQGYRKKLGSSNFDLEDRQHKFKEFDKKMSADYGMNQELKRRGGYVDVINAKSSISQEQLVSNLGKQSSGNLSALGLKGGALPFERQVLQANKALRDSKQGIIKVESQLNSTLLSNLENAKVNSVKQNTAIAQDERFRRLSGGEVYYNALTQKGYNLRTTLPDNRFKALREGEVEKSMTMDYNVTDVNKYKEMLKLAGARDAKEYEEMTGMPLPETKTITSTETYIAKEKKPPSSKKEQRKEFDESALPEAPDMPLPMSQASKKDPAVKDLPKDVEGNIDLTEYIRLREKEKMSNKGYAKEEKKEQERIMNLSSKKSQDKYTLTPSQYKEHYGMKTLGKSREELTELGVGLIDARKTLRQDYTKLSSVQAQDEYARNEQLFEDYEQETQLNLPIHGIDPFQN